MKTLDLSSDPDSKALFERNMEAIRRHSEEIAGKLEAISRPLSNIVEVAGDLNLDIGHTLFYDQGVRQFVEDQFSVFKKEPYRIDLNWPRTDNEPPQIMTKIMIRRLNKQRADRGIDFREKTDQRGVTGFAVSIGIGIGDHIGRLINEYTAQSLIVVEQFIEFLWHSLHINPWHEWIETIEGRNGRIFFILQDSAASASAELTDALRSDNGGTLDGSLIYTHYRSHLVREIHRGLSDQISYIGSNRGFFEDENIMLTNATRNFLNADYSIWRARPRREKDCPAFVVAAGPSIDQSIDVIRANKDKAVIISCGSGLRVLLEYGIKPDFHVEVENTFGQADISERVAEKYDVSGITFVGAATVNPRTANVFDRAVFFHRDTVCSTRFFELKKRPIYLAVPTVANCGIRFAVGMAFREVYMFGIDFGTRVEGLHHSKASGYYTDRDFMYSFQGTEESTEFPYTTEGNFGGTVMTSHGFLLSRLFMQKLLEAYPGYNVYNCSDGMEIPGAIAKLPGSVVVKADEAARTRALQQIDGELAHYAKGENVPASRFRDLREKTVQWFASAQETVDRMDSIEEIDPFAAYDMLWSQFRVDDEEEFDPLEAVIWQNCYGTVMTTYNVFFRMYRRVTDESARPLYTLYLEELRAFLRDMETIMLGVVDELTAEAEAVEAESAKSA